MYNQKYLKYKYDCLSLVDGVNHEYIENMKGLMRIGFNMREIIKKYFVKDFSNIRVLEIGCGNALRSIKIQKVFNFNKYDAIEPNEDLFMLSIDNCRKYNRNINFLNYDINDYNTNIKYDFIFMFNVFQFLNNESTLKKLKKLKTDDGIIMIVHPATEPNKWIDNRLNKNHPDFNEKIWFRYKNILLNTKKFLLEHGDFYPYDNKEIFIIK